MENSVAFSVRVVGNKHEARAGWHSLVVFRGTLLMFMLSSFACLSSSNPGAPANAIRIGTILPFSGHSASIGVPLESALRLAVDTVNSAGGLEGRPFYLEVNDSGSDNTAGTANALALMNANPMPFFIGPEEPDVATQLAPTIAANQMANLMPGLMSLPIHDTSVDAEWLKLTPSVNYLACAIAKQMLSDGVVTANVLTDTDEYSMAFAAAFNEIFMTLGGASVGSLQIPAENADLAWILHRSNTPTVLLTSPAIATNLLQQQIVQNQTMTWYLGPTLNNPEVLRNLPVGALEGVTGFSPDFGAPDNSFDAYFSSSTSVAPLPGAHYYYDAVALLALAIAEALAETSSMPDPVALKPHLLNVSSAGGEVVAFNQISQGLARVKAGQKVQYQGAAGINILDDQGDSTQNQVAIWQIKSTTFEVVGHQQCSMDEAYPGKASP